MADESIRAIGYKVDEVGKYVKSSKKRFEWIIGLNERTHNLVLDFSFISGKVKAYVDGRLLLENEIPINTSFQYPFTLDGFALNLIQQGQNCELRINNKVFSHLYTQEKTLMEFKKDDSEFGIKMNNEFVRKLGAGNETKKMTLDIGGINPSKKNFKKNKDDDGTWGAFTGIGFPPGLEPPPGMEVASTTNSGFGNEFAPSPSTASAEVDFFNDGPSPSPAPVPAPQRSNDLLSEVTMPQAPPSPPKPEVNINQLYNTQSAMNMNTNQLLFNTGFGNQAGHVQSPTIQSPTVPTLNNNQNNLYNTGIQLNNPGLNFGVPSAPSPAGFATGINFSTPGTQQISFSTGMPGMYQQQNSFVQPTATTPTLNFTMPVANPAAMQPQPTGMDFFEMQPSSVIPSPKPNPNFQMNSNASFQTGMLNIHQLYQTGVQSAVTTPSLLLEDPAGTKPVQPQLSASQDARLDALIFQTGVLPTGNSAATTDISFFNTMQAKKSDAPANNFELL